MKLRSRSFPSINAVAELILVGVGVVWFARFAYRFGGLVWGSDMLNYLDVGLRQIADPFIVNRYTHVYALRLASILVGNTLGGMRLYSGIAGGLTVLLTYFSARRLTKESTLPNGLIAILLLLTLPLLVRLILAPSVDTTLMVIVLAFIALYVQSSRHSGRWLVLGMGVLFILGIRTKEVAWILLAFLPGLGFKRDGDFDWTFLGKHIRFFILGTAVGILFTIGANSVILRAPLFGFRPSDYASYFSLWSNIIGTETTPAPTVSELVIGADGFIFVLFVIAGLRPGRPIRDRVRLLWLFPLLLAGFLVIATTRDAWTIVPRGFVSGLAVMGLLASQVFGVRLPISRRSIRLIVAAVAFAALFVLFGEITRDDLSFAAYFQLALAPVLLLLALAVMLYSQSREHSGWAVFVLLLALTGYSARLNLPSVVSDLEDMGWRARFSLPLALRDEIDLSRPFDAYVSWASLEGLRGVANPDELAGLVNAALDGKTVSTDYQIGVVDERLIHSMENAGHRYVIVSASEWDWLRTAPQDRPEWRAKYDAFDEPGGRYVLLTLK